MHTEAYGVHKAPWKAKDCLSPQQVYLMDIWLCGVFYHEATFHLSTGKETHEETKEGSAFTCISAPIKHKSALKHVPELWHGYHQGKLLHSFSQKPSKKLAVRNLH